MTKKRLLAFLLLLCAVFTAGCAAVEENGGISEDPGRPPVTWEDISAKNLLAGISREKIELTAVERPYETLMTELGLKLFQETLKADPDGENKLISPLSVLYAMAMVSNGADDQEAVKAYWGYDLLHINEYLYEYTGKLPVGEKYKLQLANSIWFTEDERFTVNREFLQKVKNHYDADAYQAPFNEKTLGDINEWVELKTDGMIKDILDQIPSDAVMYLVNALAFEAEWLSTYDETQVWKGAFTKADGTQQKVDFMYDTVGTYLEDEKATGFMRYYKDMKYAFVAMLPKEGVTPEEYIASLDGNALHTMLKNPQVTSVVTSIPVFETEYDLNLLGIGNDKRLCRGEIAVIFVTSCELIEILIVKLHRIPLYRVYAREPVIDHKSRHRSRVVGGGAHSPEENSENGTEYYPAHNAEYFSCYFRSF